MQRIINTSLSKNDPWKVGLIGGVAVKMQTPNNEPITVYLPKHIAQFYHCCNNAINTNDWINNFERITNVGLEASKPHTSFLWLNKRDKKTAAFYEEFKELHASTQNAKPEQMLGVIR